MSLLDFCKTLPWQAALPLFLVENLLVLLLAVGLGYLLQVGFGRARALGPLYQPVSAQEFRFAAYTLFLNTGITFVGFLLWRHGYIRIREDVSWRVLLDFLVLFLGMDLLMYVFHYGIHHSVLYRWVHGLHHHYTAPQPIDLFVLHPLETLGFGGLWLLLMLVYPASLTAIVAYLVVNVLFGALGHCGVEPYPATWARHPLLRHLGSSAFHFQHHQDDTHNFGFYTSLWDRLFGTYADGPEQK
ncbi:sterol desaturase family protein [Hymenobacter metallicola]|uniref:Fatty acid hydroxylase family protein n=1 Tax=Hymenobacter metallicola TaxID=2563114 RepID=A0A4Z0QHM2_9BACT|nr:sterol desaturase family protein [Hymenobacter metallicola]TGE28182.1 fatty acid hydroxylase family protein [Hymenobacter metallicola]